MLTRANILEAKDLETATVAVPEWGGDAIVRLLTGTERHTLYAKANAGGKFDMAVFSSLLVTMTLVDDQGVRLFADDEVAIIAGKPWKVVERIFDAAEKLNQLSKGSVEEAAKNSVPTQSDASS